MFSAVFRTFRAAASTAAFHLEKECVLGSPRLARQGFRPLGPLMVGEISALFPPLPVPVLR
jgi:hypothetical protein